MKIALIKNNIVENIIIGELQDFPEYVDVTDIYVGAGWSLNSDGSYSQPVKVKAESVERAWRNEQLKKTDAFVNLTDYPDKESLIRYRKSLRDFPEKQGFPNSDRPTKPQNIK